MTISVVSGRDLLTLEAMAAASVSTIILQCQNRMSEILNEVKSWGTDEPIVYGFI